MTDFVIENPVVFVTGQKVAYTGTSAQSLAVDANTSEVVVTLTTAGYIAMGPNPTAVSSGGSLYLPSGMPSQPIKVQGGTTKVAAIQDSASGNMHIAEYRRP